MFSFRVVIHLHMDKKENIVLDCEQDEEEPEPEKGNKDRER